VRFVYLAQEASQPPTFALIAKRGSSVNENLKKYVENFFRAHHDLSGVSLRMRCDNKEK